MIKDREKIGVLFCFSDPRDTAHFKVVVGRSLAISTEL